MKINIGGGYTRYPDFKTVDIDPLTNPDFCFNLETETYPFETSSVEEVKAHHIMEHIGPGFFHMMKELYRVCKHGALIDIVVPHHRHDIFFGDASHIRPITVEMFFQFSKKFNTYELETWRSSSGFGVRLDVDFEVVTYNYVMEQYWAEQFKTMSEEQVNRISRTYNNVIQEVHIMLMVIKT